MAAKKVAKPRTVERSWCSPGENFSAVAAPVNMAGDVLAVPEAATEAALDAPADAGDTSPEGVTVIVVVYVLVTGDVGRTSVAPPLVKSEPYSVVVLLIPTGMTMVIWPQALPETVLCE